MIEGGAVFQSLLKISGVNGLLTWISIAIIHLRFRKAFYAQKLDISALLPYKSPFFPMLPITGIFLGVVILIAEVFLINLLDISRFEK